jgi:hypothetical protein
LKDVSSEKDSTVVESLEETYEELEKSKSQLVDELHLLEKEH